MNPHGDRVPARSRPPPGPDRRAAGALVAGAVAGLVAAGTWLVHATGGTRWAWWQVLYLPVLLAAYRFGARGAVPTALAAGLAIGPAMPLDTNTATVQEPTDWVLRTGLFVAVGIFAGVGLDNTRRRHGRPSSAGEPRFGSLVHNATDVILVHDRDGTIRYASPSVGRMLDQHPDRLVTGNLSALVHPADLTSVSDGVAAAARGDPADVRFRHADGSWRHVRLLTTDLRSDPGVAGFVINGQDVTEQRAAEAELRYQAQHDPLTGLANRSLFSRRLGEALDVPHPAELGLAVFVLAPDGFEGVTDAFGHAASDQIITTLAERVQALVPRGELVARYDGSELVLLRQGVTDDVYAREIADHLRGAVDEPFPLGSEDVHLTASAGVARLDHHLDAETLIGDAYVALRAARRSGGNRSVVFHSALRRHQIQWMRTGSALQRALRGGELRAYYQPIVDMPEGRTVGFEALLRWHHPTLGVVPPADFIAVAEHNGSIVPIGAWVLREACRQLARWREEHLTSVDLSVSVNLSARQLEDPALPSIVEHALADSGIPPSRLTIEITETSVVADTPRTVTLLQNLKGLGVRIAVDDFGTGYSSLGYLRDLPIDALKIDRTFVRELGTGPNSDVIISAVAGLARSLSVRTVAEGVETRRQARELVGLGCDLQQGFWFSRPFPPEQLDVAALVRGTVLARRV